MKIFRLDGNYYFLLKQLLGWGIQDSTHLLLSGGILHWNYLEENIPHPKYYNNISVVLVGDGGYQNGSMAEILNHISK